MRICLLKSRPIGFYVGFVLILTLTLAASAIGALADSGTNATARVVGGSLTESGPNSVSANKVTLNGKDQVTSYKLALTVIDATGTGSGWNLTITSTLFKNAAGHTLSSLASTITGMTLACTGNTCTAPNNTLASSYPLIIPAGATPPQSVKFFNAAGSSGLGKFAITPKVSVAIPANTYTGSYTSTVSIAIVSGP